MLPFLKNRQEASVGGDADDPDRITRKPDEDSDYEMLDAVAEDLLMAIEKKDKKLLKEALTSLCQHIQDQDEQQDQTMMET